MAPRQTLLIEFSYLGRYFYGVQPQPGLRTVGAELQQHVLKTLGHHPRGLTLAARTDSGVSAEQNFATCWYRGHKPEASLLRSLCAPSCAPLQLKRAVLVPRSVNARSSAHHKHYQYRVCCGSSPAQLEHGAGYDAWHIAPTLSLAPMRRAGFLLEGTHDYSSFRANKCDGKNPVKTVHSIHITQRGPLFCIEVRGTAFLRKMVRIIAGTLVEVGAGLRTVDSMTDVLKARARDHAGITAPAHGLWLREVQLQWPGMRYPGMPLTRLR